MTKIESIRNMDNIFLNSFATNLLVSYRDYSNVTGDTLVKLLSNKLSKEQIDLVVSMYYMGCSLEDILTMVKPDDMFDISKACINFFPNMKYLSEVKMGQRKCDLVFYDTEKIIALEIKSKNDSALRSIGQLKDYSMWSHLTYLVFDEYHEEKILNSELNTNGTGLLKYSKGTINIIKYPQERTIDWTKVLPLLTKNDLIRIATTNKIRYTGDKNRIIQRILNKVNENVLLENYLDLIPFKSKMVNR